MKTTLRLKLANSGRTVRSILECGGKAEAATPLSPAGGLNRQPTSARKLRRRCALPEQSKTAHLICAGSNEVRRTGIVVENGMENNSSSVGAASPTARNVLECGRPLPLWPGREMCPSRKSARGLAHSKTSRSLVALFLSTLLFQLSTAFVHAQSYSVDWYKVAGGGGTSTGGTFTVSGTIGQHDAGGAMSGGNYSVTGGFWALINVVQTPGLPNLVIVRNAPNSVKVLWLDPATNSYTLQQNANLATTNWITSGFTISNASGTNSITITPPVGNLFFRLKQ